MPEWCHVNCEFHARRHLTLNLNLHVQLFAYMHCQWCMFTFNAVHLFEKKSRHPVDFKPTEIGIKVKHIVDYNKT